MSSLFISKNITFITSLTKCMKLKQSGMMTRRSYTKQSPTENIENQKTIKSFSNMVNQRRNEANRSILVQVQSAQSYKELYSYCNSLGTVKNMLHYTTGVEPMHFIIVEFSNEKDVQNTLNASTYINEQQIIPVQTQFLWFKATARKSSKLKPDKNARLLVEKGNHIINDHELLDKLRNAENVQDQANLVYNLTKLNELGVRLRFIVAKQVEMAVSGLFPGAQALPFGSSVNGYGRMGCDLDLVLRLNNDFKASTDDSRLIFHSKAAFGSERSTSQRHMEAIGDLIQLFLPGCAQVRRILQARVPIIKYNQQLANVECDLSMSNLSGVYMSDFLYLMGAIDERVRPLVFIIRKWAADVGLTNSSPGRWISNFSLTLLVLAFLQTNKFGPPILPSLNTLVKMADPKVDKFITDDGIDCTFLRDPNKFKASKSAGSENTSDLRILLKQFFEFYSQFDFLAKAVCLNEAIPITKPEHCALYIVNPLERGLNVSKNVSLDELERFIVEIRNAAWILESAAEDNTTSKGPHWGLMNLFITKKKINTAVHHNHQHTAVKQREKLIEVSKLFDDDDDNDINKENYKNEFVEKEVDRIKKETKAELKKLEHDLNMNTQKLNR